ncbi:imidazole glycerol phosphate synthase subunit HisF [bacterium]|jgi:imidazole glycerol-phosphate synthase subunit HisF|nr:imidazole glycerol phosphate synthase subunit HisF [bacterium]
MKRIRLIARLDIKGENLIKGIHLEGLRIIGSPNEYAHKYYHQGADELIFMDTVASLYGRNHLGDIIKSVAKDIFIPMTVGGGIRSVEDAIAILRLGADKVAVNTAAVTRPELISEISNTLGSQAMVLSVEAKKIESNKWEVYTNNGREGTGIDVIEWAIKGEDLGAGEILLTSVDCEGTRRGFDLDLIKATTGSVSIPVIASGGMGKYQDLYDAVYDADADAIAMADVLHYNRLTFDEIRKKSTISGIIVRDYD